jgi:uroporphyrinogen decarboxylase
MPIYGWLGNDEFKPKVVEAFGSVDAAQDKYEFDLIHTGADLTPFRFDLLHDAKMSKPDGKIKPAEALDIPLTDPDDMEKYASLKKTLQIHREEKGRFAYNQTWGYFEGHNTVFGFEDHLMYMLLYPEEMKVLYKRQAAWNLRFAHNVLDLGVDMVHISDDWGAQRGLLFNPALWWEMIYPNYIDLIAAVKKRKGYISLHSDGNVSQVLDGVVKLGFDVVHPYQESAGMDFSDYFKKYSDRFTIMGGLDVQSTIGFGNYDFLRSEITRILNLFKDRGLLFCTTHSIQPHCSIEEFIFAYDFIYEYIRE